MLVLTSIVGRVQGDVCLFDCLFDRMFVCLPVCLCSCLACIFIYLKIRKKGYREDRKKDPLRKYALRTVLKFCTVLGEGSCEVVTMTLPMCKKVVFGYIFQHYGG